MQLDFVVAGFSKCGTTSLCGLLTNHPGIFLPPRFKEPRFFNRPDYALYWSWYHDLFYTAPANTLLGEGSVSYSEAEFAEVSIARLTRHFPEIKVILIARDPVTRIESSYREMHNSGADWGIEAVFNIEKALGQIPNILEDTKYWSIVELYSKYLPKEQLLVLFQEDLKVNPEGVLQVCFSFLNVASTTMDLSKEKKSNKGSNKYYDTSVLRELRNEKLHAHAARALSKIPTAMQNQFMPQLSLRKPFGSQPLEWSPKARKKLLATLGPGPKQFLEKYGKPISFWPKYAAFLSGA